MLALTVCGAAPVASAQPSAPNLNGYVTLSTGYWKRGLAQNDGRTAQLGIDYEHHSGFYVGAWAANVDFAREYSEQQPRRIEADVYGGFHRQRGQWSWNVGLAHYAYPHTAVDYDYSEVNGTVGYRDRLFYSAAYSDSYYGLPRSSLNQEVSLAFPLRWNLEIGAAAGAFRVRGDALDVTYWNVGVSKLVRRLAIDVRYYDGNHTQVGYFGDPHANHVVLSLSYALRGPRPRI
ncbi:MAG TPA: TorF family putative porin [Gammaproteobacteria bacterium]|jgi:uncharacterized protein (TIGR02001 family)|nr:TorF family putative porin [Gammaproteobacteria bacterium]